MATTIEETPVETPAQAMKRHNRVLLHALQTAHPVLYQGKQRFIHTFLCQIMGGTTETTVYLTGDRTPVQADQLTLYQVPG